MICFVFFQQLISNIIYTILKVWIFRCFLFFSFLLCFRPFFFTVSGSTPLRYGLGANKPSTLFPIKMLVSSLTELHTPRQTSPEVRNNPGLNQLLDWTLCSSQYWLLYCIMKCNSPYGLEHMVQSNNWFKQRLFLTYGAKT